MVFLHKSYHRRWREWILANVEFVCAHSHLFSFKIAQHANAMNQHFYTTHSNRAIYNHNFVQRHERLFKFTTVTFQPLFAYRRKFSKVLSNLLIRTNFDFGYYCEWNWPTEHRFPISAHFHLHHLPCGLVLVEAL